jgi:hypothetical protein
MAERRKNEFSSNSKFIIIIIFSSICNTQDNFAAAAELLFDSYHFLVF